MKPRILAIDTPIQELITGACLRAHPFLAAQAAQMDALRDEWAHVHQRELDLIRAQLEAEARVLTVDRMLDFLCTAIAGTLLVENGNGREGVVWNLVREGVEAKLCPGPDGAETFEQLEGRALEARDALDMGHGRKHICELASHDRGLGSDLQGPDARDHVRHRRRGRGRCAPGLLRWRARPALGQDRLDAGQLPSARANCASILLRKLSSRSQ